MPSNFGEDIFEEALKEMIKEDETIVGSLKIVGFLKNKSNDRLDVEGIDFLIFLSNGLAFPSQIKGLKNKSEQALLQEHLRKHPLIKFLFGIQVYSNDREKTIRDIKRSIRSKIRNAMPRPA